MSSLEVLQSCPVQQNALLSILGAQDPNNLNDITFPTQEEPCLTHHVPIQIHVAFRSIHIRMTAVDEWASTCVMSSSCWKALGSP